MHLFSFLSHFWWLLMCTSVWNIPFFVKSKMLLFVKPLSYVPLGKKKQFPLNCDMVVSYQLTFLFSTYLKSSFIHWFFHLSLLCIDKKENICEIHLPVSAFCLRDVCVCLSETSVIFLCTSKLWWMQCFLSALGSHRHLASCRVGQLLTLLGILSNFPIHPPLLSHLILCLEITLL